MDVARWIIRTLLVTTDVAAILSVIVYSRAPWRDTSVGKHLMAFMAALAAVLTITMVVWVFPSMRGNPAFLAIYVCVFITLPIVVWWRFFIIWEARHYDVKRNEGARMASTNPTDVKVPVAATVSAFGAAIVVLIMNAINKEPMDQAALEAVLSAVILWVITFGAGWLKKTPLTDLRARVAANAPRSSTGEFVGENNGR